MQRMNIYQTLSTFLCASFMVFSGISTATASQNVHITMKDNGYHFKSGTSSGTLTPGFTMSVGEVNEIMLKNEDTTAHDFVSKAFTGMEVKVSGEAESIQDGKANGWRVQPGQSVSLKFTPKVGKDFSGSYDVFYCTIHGKPNMKGEIVIADTRTGTDGF